MRVRAPRCGEGGQHDDEETAPHARAGDPQTRGGREAPREGKTIDEVVRHLEITESTWHRWRNQYGGMKADDAKELRELRKENAQV